MRRIYALLLAALLLLSGSSQTYNPHQHDTSGIFSTLSYNIEGEHSLLTGKSTLSRFKTIASLVGELNPDVIGFQEDFLEGDGSVLRETLHDRMGHMHRVGKPLLDVTAGSGLTLLSSMPILRSMETCYHACNGNIFDGVLGNGNDCHAQKGFSFTIHELGVVSIHVYNTHLDAGDFPGDLRTRATQLRRLETFINKHSKDHAVILMGDINVDGTDLAQRAPLDRLLAETGLVDAVTGEGTCSSSFLHDGIFYRSTTNIVLTVDNVEDISERFVGLSDHSPMFVHFSWRTE